MFRHTYGHCLDEEYDQKQNDIDFIGLKKQHWKFSIGNIMVRKCHPPFCNRRSLLIYSSPCKLNARTSIIPGVPTLTEKLNVRFKIAGNSNNAVDELK